MKHKLIKRENGEIITGQDLKDRLIAEGFTLAPIEPVTRFRRPVKPDASIPKAIITPTGPVANPVWVAYYEAFRQYNMDQAVEYAVWNAEINDAVEVLTTTFDGIVTYVKTGETNPNGTAVWAWLPSTVYTYRQCAEVLTGPNRPADLIDFICFQYFGS